MEGDKLFFCINVTEYDDTQQNRVGAERNTQKLIETFKEGVDGMCSGFRLSTLYRKAYKAQRYSPKYKKTITRKYFMC